MNSAIPNHIPSQPRPGPIGRWYLPVMALISIGFGVSNYYSPSAMNARIETRIREEERLKRNKQLMDAYGHKDSLQDVERALEAYEVQ
ncbi:uncharacterized protein EURHEDRAFT_376074 [Aspergillus ruber CBS 135680]|uniref:Uncharacterized protein n=1 Tax=Aspergillus ruber (strain CBS 135680) TaxID=1388766 RepID=A0A017SIK1_ASPRC|nr:uncharacterized protein EURHEDRAFT_376074 [Aspergillus ruber CBS 135680]EYE96788.1 hypothetical protein EURHEDRAFT_376074 [Aspergillus ruber CBS 135680]